MVDSKVERLVISQGKARVLEFDDGRIERRENGSVSWRNNNPGNLKFEYAGSADKTVRSTRLRSEALIDAKARYQGVVDLDHWGNAVFASYEDGRAAKIRLLERAHGDKTIEAMLRSYSRADYSGATHHRAQAESIFREGDRQGFDLRSRRIGEMTSAEMAALADGIREFEGWKVGETVLLKTAERKVGIDLMAAASIYAAARSHFFAVDGEFEYGRPDASVPGRDPSRAERDLDGDGRKGVDCSAFVWRSLKNAGYGVSGETAEGFTTRTLFMGSQVTAYAQDNFDVIPGSAARAVSGDLKQGDLLMFASPHGQHVGIFKGYDLHGRIQFVGSQASSGPSEVTVVPDGYWDGDTMQIVGALRAKPAFRSLQPAPAAEMVERMRGVPATSRPDAVPKHAYHELRQGDKGAAVKELQSVLRELGYCDPSGRILALDGDFGARTTHAVKAYQQAHGLNGDGVVGKLTSHALTLSQQAPLLSDVEHRDHALYIHALRGIEQLPSYRFDSEAERANAAATLAFEARVSGLGRIDHVVANVQGTGLFAVQGGLSDPAHRRVYVDREQAARQPVSQSSEQLRIETMATQGRELPHGHAYESPQVRVQQQHVEQRGMRVDMRP